MKKLSLHLHRFSAVQVAIFLLILGVFSGIVFANVFQNSYRSQMQLYEENIFSDIRALKINYSGLFSYILWKNLKEYAIFWLLSITILGIPYMAYKTMFFGFSTGFFISSITMQFGFKGILLIIAYVFPQGLLYLPIAVICLYKGFSLCKMMYYENRNQLESRLKLIAPQLMLLVLLAIVILIGSFLEAYVGSFLLRKTLQLFS